MRVIAIIGDYGRHWEVCPLIARDGAGTLVFFVDYRTPPDVRRASLEKELDGATPDSLEMMYVDRIPVDCANNVHLWEPLTRGDKTIGACCDVCGARVERDVALPFAVVSGRDRVGLSA